MDSLFELLGVGVRAAGWLLGAIIVACLVGGAIWIVIFGLLFRLMGG